MDTQGLLGEKYGNIRIPGEVEASEFEMILDAAIEAKLETKLLEEWYCRDENSVPAAYYLRPKSEMLKSNKNAVSDLSLQSMCVSITFNRRSSRGGSLHRKDTADRNLVCPGRYISFQR